MEDEGSRQLACGHVRFSASFVAVSACSGDLRLPLSRPGARAAGANTRWVRAPHLELDRPVPSTVEPPLAGEAASGHSAVPSGAAAHRAARYLQPGGLLVSSEAAAVTTVLGSCVAVCLWDERLCVGGMNHYVLPTGGGRREATFRFGMVAMAELVAAMHQLGSLRADLQAKVFGGSRILGCSPSGPSDLGVQNVELARACLDEASIPVVAEDVGGPRARKIVFQTDTGIALVRKL